MAFSQKISSTHWIVHLQSPTRSEVKVEVHMSHEEARKLANPKGLAAVAIPAGDLGAAILHRLTSS